MPLQAAQSAPWETLVCCLVLLVAPAIAMRTPTAAWQMGGLVIALAVTLFAGEGAVAYGAAAGAALLHAVGAWRWTRTGAVALGVAAVLTAAAGVALWQQHLTTAFCLSALAIAVRAGVMPFHAGASSLCERALVVQSQQLATTIALVFVHLRFVDHHDGAIALAPLLVRLGAAVTFVPALMSIVQRDLRGFYRTTTALHGGMLLAAIGAASLDNFAAALLVMVTMGLALGGLGIAIAALEERVGRVDFSGPGGRVQSFPRLAAAFAFFGAAGVGLPATAGFVADDLLLHTLWIESPASAVTVIVSSALLAVATLTCFARVFLGRATPSVAPDISRHESGVLVTLLVLLVVLGIAPGTLLAPADAFLSVVSGSR